MAPEIAAIAIPAPANVGLLKMTPPEASISAATPREAPDEIPKTDGPAKGFRKRVCISNPLSAREPPAIAAVKALGILDSNTITFQAGSDTSPFTMIFSTLTKGIETGPDISSKANKATTRAAVAIIIKDLLLLNGLKLKVRIYGQRNFMRCIMNDLKN